MMDERTSGDFEGLFESVDRTVDESDNVENAETNEEEAESHGIDMDDDDLEDKYSSVEDTEEPEVEEGCGKHKKAKKVLESDGPHVDVEALKQQYKLINREVDYGSLVTEDLELMDGLNSFLQDTIERAGGELDNVMLPGIKQDYGRHAARNQQEMDAEED